MRIHFERQGSLGRGFDHAAPEWLAALTGDGHELIEHTDGVDAVSVGGDDALVVCHRADRRQPVPEVADRLPVGRVIVVSDVQDEATIVATLEAGSHHYFAIDETPRLLSVRVAAALREHQSVFQQDLVVEPFRFDRRSRLVFRHGEPVALSPREFEFAYYLFANRDRTIGNDELMVSVWSLPHSMDTRRIDTAACRLRKKMPLDGDAGWLLHRERRIGYELRAFAGKALVL